MYILHYSKHQKTLLLCQINIAVFLKIEPSSVYLDIALHAHTSGDIESGGKNGKIVENTLY